MLSGRCLADLSGGMDTFFLLVKNLENVLNSVRAISHAKPGKRAWEHFSFPPLPLHFNGALSATSSIFHLKAFPHKFCEFAPKVQNKTGSLLNREMPPIFELYAAKHDHLREKKIRGN